MRRVLLFVSLLLLCSIRALYAQGVDESKVSLYGNEFSTSDLDNIYDQLPSGSSNINPVIYLLRNHNDRNKFKVDNSNTRRLRSKHWRWLYGEDRDNVVIEHNTPTRTPRE